MERGEVGNCQTMNLQIDLEIEGRLRSLLMQLQAECGIYERMVYKNKNQHRRSSYFQYLLKVRRDLRLLQLASLGDVLDSCLLVLTGNRPKQKLHLLESLKRRKCKAGKPNFMEQLLGAARLLSQMVEPILRAATEVSTLLARSFFMGFSMTILALLARLRVLVQQILLDVVSLFNAVSSLSQKKLSIKIAQEGVEVYREFYPKTEEYITLECLWKTDKFVLVEKINKCEMRLEADVAAEIAIQYQNIESFLGDDDELSSEKTDASCAVDKSSKRKRPECLAEEPDKSFVGGTPVKSNLVQAELPASASSSKPKSTARKVAFVSVKRPNPSTTNQLNLPQKDTVSGAVHKTDAFYSLLTGGNFKDSLV